MESQTIMSAKSRTASLSLVIALVLTMTLGCGRRDVFWDYGDYTLEALGGGEFNTIQFKRSGEEAKWHIKCKSVGEFSPDNLSLKDVQKFADARSSTDENGEITIYIDADMFTFRNDRLVWACISHINTNCPAGIATTPNGPFLELPATQAKVREMLGKPDKSSSAPTSLR